MSFPVQGVQQITALGIGAIVCQRSNGSKYYAFWKIFYPDCRKRFVLCNSGAGAYVAAITVCLQNL